jgi:hypothetical protein
MREVVGLDMRSFLSIISAGVSRLISTSAGALDMRVVRDKSQTYEVSADVVTFSRSVTPSA